MKVLVHESIEFASRSFCDSDDDRIGSFLNQIFSGIDKCECSAIGIKRTAREYDAVFYSSVAILIPHVDVVCVIDGISEWSICVEAI